MIVANGSVGCVDSTRMKLNITAQKWNGATWQRMVHAACVSRMSGTVPQHICKVMCPPTNYNGRHRGLYMLELKTDQEIAEHLQQYGWSGICRKMPLSNVLNLTRISIFNEMNEIETIRQRGRPEDGTSIEDIYDGLVTEVNVRKEELKRDLNFCAERAERKYNNGFKGLVRRVIAVFLNLFVSDSERLFSMPDTNRALSIERSDRCALPWFIGDDAQFARWLHTKL